MAKGKAAVKARNRAAASRAAAAARAAAEVATPGPPAPTAPGAAAQPAAPAQVATPAAGARVAPPAPSRRGTPQAPVPAPARVTAGPPKTARPARPRTPPPVTLAGRSLPPDAGWWMVGGGLALVAILLWLGGALTSAPFTVFLIGCAAAATYAAKQLVAVAPVPEPWRAARKGVALLLVGFVPVIFDPHTVDVFNVSKYTAAVIGAAVLAALWVVEGARQRRLPFWRNGLQWPILAVVAWTVVTTGTSIDPRLSLLGAYGSYHGLFLTLALAMIAFAVAEAFTLDDALAVVSVLFYAAGGITVLYGVIQLHDREVSGHPWEFVRWGKLPFHNVFSTFGNPNHLAGFLAIIFPVGVVLLVLNRNRWARIFTGVILFALLAVLIETAARGAWLATIAAVAVVAVGLLPELRRRPVVPLAVAAGVVVVLAGGMALGGGHYLGSKVTSLFQTGAGSSVSQRFQYWHAAAAIGAHHPIVGTGPDTYRAAYRPFQGKALAALLEPAHFEVNGAHDIFMQDLSDEGIVGLVLFVALLGYAGLRSIGGWRRLRAVEVAEAERADGRRSHRGRLVLTAVAAGLLAFVVQAVFNVNQVGLSFAFWLLLGLLCAIASDARVPDTLAPLALVARGDGEESEGIAPPEDLRRASAGVRPGRLGPVRGGARGRASRRRQGPDWALVGAAVAAAVVLGFVGAGAVGPLRADHQEWAATHVNSSQAGGNGSSTQAVTTTALYQSAIALNPWEPSYDEHLAQAAGQSAAAAPRGSATVLADLQAARQYAQRAASLASWSPTAEEGYAAVLLKLDQVTPDPSLRLQAMAALRQAVRDDPYDPSPRATLAQLHVSASGLAPAAGPSKG